LKLNDVEQFGRSVKLWR